MANLILDERDQKFVLFEMLQAQKLCDFPKFEEFSQDMFEMILSEAQKFALEEIFPTLEESDKQGCTLVGGQVHVPECFHRPYKLFCEAGWNCVSSPPEFGGQGLPFIMRIASHEWFMHNFAFSSYPGLGEGAAHLIHVYGSEEQKQKYLPQMTSGQWGGSMCLTEPGAGTDVGNLSTKAIRRPDGTFRIKGTKMFITGGDQDLTENIIHPVLARIEGDPAGTKGISIFIVPKFMVNEDGSLGERNDVTLAGLIHKMGYRGTTSTMLNFGEQGGAVGYLVGEPNQGLAQMFHMMNEARIGVGLGSVMLGYTGYLHALEYARERRQGRPLKERDPQSPMIPLIQHADIRRMLLSQKAFVEGGLSLCLYAATLSDEKKYAEDPLLREESAGLLDLLIPIVKSWPSQFCVEANSLAIQVHGGYGYTREYPVEQFYRDNRLNPIHEGTHGIQGQDLLGRKVPMQEGRFYKALVQHIRETIAACAGIEQLQASSGLLGEALDTLQAVTESLQAVRREDTERGLANAYLYMECFGHVVVGWMWLRQAQTALRGLQQGGDRPRAFYEGKLRTCEYFLRYELPKPLALAKVLGQADRSTLDMPADCF